MHRRITPLDALRAGTRVCSCSCSCSPATTSYARYAHAAAFEAESDQKAARDSARSASGPSFSSSSSASASGSSPSSSRPKRPATEYRFPERGARGGPPDPYEVLGLQRGADGAEIKSAYYALALLLHPDSSHPSASADHFATLNRAYKLLSTPAARNSYLSTGYGWSPSAGFDTGYSMRADDEAMREMIRRARRGGAAEWSGRGFRDAEAGKGAWAYRNVNGREWHPYDADGHASGGGDGLYMSNNKFMALVAALAGIWAVVQVMRIGGVADHTREALVDRHISASKALAEARHEAAMFGQERREQLRRRVRESAVMEEIERMEHGGGQRHTRSSVPDSALDANAVPALPAPR